MRSFNPQIRYSRDRMTVLAFGLAAVLGLSGCGKTAFVVTDANIKATAPGSFSVPAKVDILLAEDDTGSIKEIYSAIAQQMPGFLSGLESNGWDYHFATTGLTRVRAMSQVLPSRHDSNYYGLGSWTAPYPGASLFGPGTVTPSVFRTSSQYSGFINFSDTSNAGGGIENGFETIRSTLVNQAPGTNFLRPDAMLVMLVVGNGDDTSKVNYCTRSDGITVPCEQMTSTVCSDISQAGQAGATCGSTALSLNWYASQFQAMKTSAAQVKFYAAVGDGSANCLGKKSRVGTRYTQMSYALGGVAYNVCAAPVSSLLSGISSNLRNTRMAMRTRYLFVDQEPDESSIEVTKYKDGSAAQALLIPQDAENGWTYVGNVSNVFAIDSPIPMNLSSGWAIELHGSAKLLGDDTANIKFRRKGAQNSAN